MKYRFTRQRKIAISLLLLWGVNIFTPSVTYALTSGPAQPETRGFMPAGVSDMVDLQTGDFKYNIPLLDIDGYPINLNYASGVGMDDEASWVGLGWSLNPGAINRQLRGLPDDFSGDNLETDHWTKPKITVGGKATAKVETLGMVGFQFNGSFSLGLFSDNYTGIGAELGVNGGISYGIANSGFETSGTGLGVLGKFGANGGVSSNTQSGADATLSPYVSLSIREKSTCNWTESAGLTGSLGYNSRSGLKSLTLGTTFGVSGSYTDECKGDKYGNPEKSKGSGSYNPFGAILSYNTEPLSPSTQIPYSSTYDSFSFDFGGELLGVYGSVGGMGYMNVRKVAHFVNNRPGYGFLYAERGKDNMNAQMDFIREKDNPIIKGIPNIAIPIHTPDLWSYSSQAGSGQFRLYRGGSGAFFDNQAVDEAQMNTSGGDYGMGAIFHGGITHFEQTTHNVTRKWKKDNAYLPKGDFQSQDKTDPRREHVYFRMSGEKNLEDEEVNAQVHNEQPLAVNTDNISATADFAGQGGGPAVPLTGAIEKKNTKRNNRTEISYLTADEARYGALDRKIPVFDFYGDGTFQVPANNKPLTVDSLPRVNQYRKGHHISELRITDGDGKRMVYGIPVYNTVQTETTFAVSPSGGTGLVYGSDNLVDVPPHVSLPGSPLNDYGVDNYFHQEKKPAYATSFLLSAILSPDYVDKTGNGITDDDQGTAIKFNYARITNFKWRAPYTRATLNKGLLADPDDDKGSIIYGEKEIWHVSSIETKTKVVYFITADRNDGLGVDNWQNGGLPGGFGAAVRQKCLKEIRLYSKADMTRPIKVVKFDYTYQLCPNVPNYHDFSGQGIPAGKLTLAKVWFEYGNSDKGRNHAYQFTYNTANNVAYGNMLTDRWGNYKDPAVNPMAMDNEHYPYSDQNATAKANAGLWHLQQVDLPTGGTIKVDYEPGDYAYVQDKKAMTMTGVLTLIDAAGVATGGLNVATGLRIRIGADAANAPASQGLQTDWFKEHYLDGADHLYTKLLVNFRTGNGNAAGNTNSYDDYVPCYAKVTNVSIDRTGGTADISFEPLSEAGVSGKNPIVIAAWQRLKNEYPRYAYPGYNNRLKKDGSVMAAVTAIADAAKNLSELFEGFYHKADRVGYCSAVDLNRSFVRITKADGFKQGGSARVSKVQLTDNWDQNGSNGQASTYGQAYTYTTTEGTQPISSGVAAYEPSIGNDENPLRQPVQYVQHVAGGINNFFDLEMPFCESLFPAPQVVYSKVTVHDLGAGQVPSNNTGYTVTESYTAKDFPVRVTVLPLIDHAYAPTTYYSLTSTNAIDEMCLSQGYSIELNDMHGKPKATRVYNKAGAEIASTVYYYSAIDKGGTMSLNNLVNVIGQDGQQSPHYLGRDIEFFTDFREQESDNQGQTINIGGDVFTIPFIPGFMGFPHVPVNDNNEYRLFRSACALKVVQQYGIMSKVVKTQNGSSVTSENIAYDGVTGEPLVTRTQNEFNKDIYSVNIPAYWAYRNMGGSYQTDGVILSDLKTNQFGVIQQPIYSDFFTAGDELINLYTGDRYWVGIAQSGGGTTSLRPRTNRMESNAPLRPADAAEGVIAFAANGENGDPKLRFRHAPGDGYAQVSYSNLSTGKFLMDRNGAVIKNLNYLAPYRSVKVVRSGYRNVLSAGMSGIVCLNNPIVNNQLQLALSTDLTDLKVINASASTYNELWAVKPGCTNDHTTEDQTTLGPNGFMFTAGGGAPGHAGNGIYAYTSQDPASSAHTDFFRAKLQERFDAAAIWLGNTAFENTLDRTPGSIPDRQVGLETDFTIKTEGDYYVGYSGDNIFSYTIDQTTLPIPNTDFTGLNGPPTYWYLFPKHLTAGKHHLIASATNVSFALIGSDSQDNLAYNPGDISLEIYNNSLTELQSPSTTYTIGGSGNVVFSTASIPGQQPPHSVQSSITIAGVKYNRYDYNYCINPYVDGFLGNWRPLETKVFQQNRKYVSGIFSPTNKGVEVKNAGTLDQFYSHWYYNIGSGSWLTNPNGTAWVTANTVTLYDKYGQQLENKDALQRYSAANFDFNGELPSAVASNAMHREIYTNSFEDVNFDPGTVVQPCAIAGFNLDRAAVRSDMAHSGNYAYLLPALNGITLSTNCYTSPPADNRLLVRNAVGEYNVQKDDITQVDKTGVYPQGFESLSGKEYLLDVWVNDGQPSNRGVNVMLTVNNVMVSNLTCKAVVEGWKLLEARLDASIMTAGDLKINIAPVNATVYIDDLRIHPKQSQMKTYVYDDKTLRLMAELDENGFATFYEYDDEGLLVRVKKETEKGIMTLKESRSSYKKQ